MTLTDLQVDILKSKHLKLADGEEGQPDADAVPQSSHHGVPQHRANVLEERPGGHEVAAVEDDGREHVKEEDVGAEDGGGLLFDRVHDAADDKADGDQEAGLRDPDSDFMVNVETWRNHNESLGSCLILLWKLGIIRFFILTESRLDFLWEYDKPAAQALFLSLISSERLKIDIHLLNTLNTIFSLIEKIMFHLEHLEKLLSLCLLSCRVDMFCLTEKVFKVKIQSNSQMMSFPLRDVT